MLKRARGPAAAERQASARYLLVPDHRCPEKGEAPGSCTARESSAKAAPNVKANVLAARDPHLQLSLILPFLFLSSLNETTNTPFS